MVFPAKLPQNRGMGQFERGQQKPPGSGRKKGIPNKRTELLRDVLENLECDVPQKLIALLPSLPPDGQAHVLLELLSYLYPRRKAMEPVTSAFGLSVEQTRNFFFNITADPETRKAAEFVAERISSGETTEPTE